MRPMVSNLQAFKHSLEAVDARLKNGYTKAYQAHVTKMLKDLVLNTPQWSGDLAASWQVVVGSKAQAVPHGYTMLKDTAYMTKPQEGADRKSIGDTGAWGLAYANNMEAIASIRWNSHVSIQNVSKTLTVGNPDGHPLVDEGQLRPGNFIEGDFMAVQYVAMKYVDSDLSISRYRYGT